MSSVVVPGGGIIVADDAEPDAEVTGPAVVELGFVFPVPLSVSVPAPDVSSDGQPSKRHTDPTIAPQRRMREGSHGAPRGVWQLQHVFVTAPGPHPHASAIPGDVQATRLTITTNAGLDGD
jgi:hypothetical protein